MSETTRSQSSKERTTRWIIRRFARWLQFRLARILRETTSLEYVAWGVVFVAFLVIVLGTARYFASFASVEQLWQEIAAEQEEANEAMTSQTNSVVDPSQDGITAWFSTINPPAPGPGVEERLIDARAKTGDYVGGVLGLWIGLASAMLFFAALLLQKIELGEQRKEMRRMATEATKQAESMLKQNQIAGRATLYERVLSVNQAYQERVDTCRNFKVQLEGMFRSMSELNSYKHTYREAAKINRIIESLLCVEGVDDWERDALRTLVKIDDLRTSLHPSTLSVYPGTEQSVDVALREEIERLIYQP